MGKNLIKPEQMVEVLNVCYEKALDGVLPGEKSVKKLADDYLRKNSSTEKAINSLITYQTTLCSSIGFATGLGGLAVLPVNVTSTIYLQIRTVAAIAYMNGYDLNSDQVRVFVFICLLGNSGREVLKTAGIKFGEKLALSTIKKIPGKVLIEINKKVGFRLVTKFGEKGIVNFMKLIPLAGAGVGAVVDGVTELTVAKTAKKLFSRNEILVGSFK